VAGRDSFKPQPPDVPGLWFVMGREKREYDALESKYRVKVPVWAACHFEGRCRIQMVFYLVTKNQSKAP